MIPGTDPRLDIAVKKMVGSEELLVTQLVGRTLTVLRAQNGTLPGTHAAGDLIRLDGLWRPGDQAGTASAPLAPWLGPLQANHGPVPTHALLANSPALDAGEDALFGGLQVPVAAPHRLPADIPLSTAWTTLPSRPFDLRLDSQALPIVAADGQRLTPTPRVSYVRSPGWSAGAPYYDLDATATLLADQRGAARLFKDASSGYTGGGTGGSSASLPGHTIDVGAYELVPELSLSAPAAVVLEGTSPLPTQFTFRVSRAGRTSGQTTVDYVLSAVGAHPVSPTDFASATLPRGTLTFAPGQTVIDVQLEIAAETMVEHDETFEILLTNATPGAWILERSVQGTIVDDDTAALHVTQPSVVEGSGLLFDVTLENGVQGGFHLPWQTVDGTARQADQDYVAAAGTLTFAGDPAETHRIQIATLPDETVERHETLQLLAGALAGLPPDLAARVALPEPAVGTISNDDTTTVRVEHVRRLEGDSGSSLWEFQVTLGPQPVDTAVAVTAVASGLTAAAGEDFQGVTATLNFDGSAGQTRVFSVPVFGDLANEPAETFAVSLAAAEAGGREPFITLGSATGTIANDDDPRLVVRDVTQGEGDSSSGDFLFEVVLLNPLGGPLAVTVTTADGTATAGEDYLAHSQTLNFAGLAGETHVFAVTVDGDGLVERDETIQVELSSLQAGGQESSYTLVNGVGTIRNDDQARLTFLATPPCPQGSDPRATACRTETSGAFVFRAVLEGDVDVPFTVTAATYDETAIGGADYDQAQVVLPFSGQDGESVPFSVYVRDDGLVEPDETLGVRLVNLQAQARAVELGPSAVALILSDEPPDPIPGDDEEEEEDDPPCIPADGGGETNPPEPGSSPPLGWFPADWTPPAQGATSWGATFSAEQFVSLGLFVDARGHLILPDGTVATSFGIVSNGSGWFSVVTPPGVPLFDPYWTGGASGPGGGTEPGETCPPEEDEEDEEDPTFYPLETVSADWVVPYTESLTFNPFPTFNYRLAQDVALTVGDGQGGFVPVGGSVTLTFGTVTVNPDFTLTYTPAADLPTRTGENRLKPEVDAHGNVFRYTGSEHFETHLVDAGAVVESPSGGGEGELPVSPFAYASVPVELAVSNHLPTLRGDRIHAPDAFGRFYLDSPVFVDLDTTVRVDLKQLFVDRDGDGDLAKLRIKEVGYNGERLNMSQAATVSTLQIVDRYPNQIRIPIATTTSGLIVNDSVGNPLMQFGGDETEPAIIAMPAGASAIDFHNTISSGLIATLTDAHFPSQLDFQVTLTDGSQRPVFDFYGQPKLDANGQAVYEEVTWDVMIRVQGNPDNPLEPDWRAATLAPAVDFQPWIAVVTPKIDPLIPDDTPRASTNWSLTTSQPSMYGGDLESVGGVAVDLHAGEFQRYHDLVLDGSGGASELAIPGLVYDSSTVHVNGTAMPVVTAVVRNQSGSAATSIQATLTWYNHSGPVTSTWTNPSPDPFASEYVIALSPPEIDDFTGVYGWELTVHITVGGETVTLTQGGETPVIVGDHLAIFGAGWGLQGVPMMWLDTRDESDHSVTRNTYDDRLILGFPGEAPKIFNAMLLTLNDFSYAGELASLQPGSTAVSYDGFRDPREFGTLISRQDPNELIYDDGTGREYVFRKHEVNGKTTYLIHRIEQPGIEFARPGNAWPAGRRGLSFEWGTATDSTLSPPAQHPILVSLTATDGAKTDFEYTSDGYLEWQRYTSQGSLQREVYFEVNSDRDLVEIRHRATPGVNSAGDRIRRFSDRVLDAAEAVLHDYDGRMAVDRWFNGSNDLIRYTQFDYDTTDAGTLRQIQFGDGVKSAPGDSAEMQNVVVYGIRSAAATAMSDANLSVDELVATVTQVVGDLQSYRETDEGPGKPVGPAERPGTYTTDYEFSLDGLLERREEYFAPAPPDACDPAADPFCDPRVSLSVERWDYDHVGLLKRYTDPLGRRTFYWHDYEEPTYYTTTDPSDVNDDKPRYDPNDCRGNVTYVFTPAGQTVYEYETDDEMGNALGRLVKQIDKPKISATGTAQPGGTNAELVTIYDYRADGQLTRRQTIRGNQDRVTDLPQGTVTTAAADAAALPAAALGKEDRIELWTYTSDNRLGSFKDARGLLTEYTAYDSWGRLTSAKTTDDYDGQATVTVNSYDALGHLDTVTVADGAAWPAYFSLTDYDYDRTGLLQQVQIKNAGGIVLRRDQYEYAPDGVLTATIDGNGVRNVSTYDKAGLLTRTVAAVGQRYFSLYTGQEEDVAQTTSYYYYADGTLSHTELPGGYTQSTYEDPLARTEWVQISGVSAGTNPNATHVSVAQRDVLGRTTAERDLLTGAETRYEYEDVRHDLPTKISEIALNHGSLAGVNLPTNIADLAWQRSDIVTSLAYDANGNVLQQSRPGLASLQNRYDALGHLDQTAFLNDVPGATPYVSLESATNAAGDVVQQAEYRRTWQGASWATKRYTSSSAYDEQGRLRRVTDALSTEDGVSPATADYGFDSATALLKVTSKTREGNTSVRWLDAANLLVQEQTVWGGISEYKYDAAGNLVAQSSKPDATSALTRRLQFRYDALNRLRATIRLDVQPTFSAVDYFLPTSPNAGGWSQIAFSPLEITDVAHFAVNAAATYAIPSGVNLQTDWATKTKTDSIGKTYLIQMPAPGDVGRVEGTAPDHGALAVTKQYNYDAGNSTYTVITTQLGAKATDDGVDDLRSSSVFNTHDQLLASTTSSLSTAPGVFPSETLNATYNYTSFGQLELERDRAGHATNYSDFDPVLSLAGKVAKGNFSEGLLVQSYFVFDSAGNLTRYTDPEDNTTIRRYDALNRLIEETIGIDDASLLDSTQGKLSNARNWEYHGNTVVYSNRNSEVIVTRNDTANRRVTEEWHYPWNDWKTDPPVVRITTEFTPYGEPAEAKTEALSTAITATSLDTSTTFHYDDQGRLDRELQDVAFAGFAIPTIRTDTTYYSTGPRNALALWIDEGAADTDMTDDLLVLNTSYTVDQLGRVVGQLQDFKSTPDPTAKQQWANESIAHDRLVHYRYDADNTLRQFERFDGTTPDASDSRGVTSHAYDGQARRTWLYHDQRTNPDTHIAKYHVEYNTSEQLLLRSTELYDNTGALLSDFTRKFKYDNNRRLVDVGTLDPTAPDGVRWDGQAKSHDEGGNRTDARTIRDPNRLVEDPAYTYKFDREGRVVLRTAKPDNNALINDDAPNVSYSFWDWDDAEGVIGSSPAEQQVSDDGGAWVQIEQPLTHGGDYDLWLIWKKLSNGGIGHVTVAFVTGGGATVETLFTGTIDYSLDPQGFWLSTANTWQRLTTFHPEQPGTLRVRIEQEGAAPIAFDALQITPAYATTEYQWDYRGRLVRETIENPQGDQTIEYGYDALNRLVSRETTREDLSKEWTGYAYQDGKIILEFNEQKEIIRSWLYSPVDGQALAVDEVLPSPGKTTTLWLFSDLAGTVRSVARVDGEGAWHVVHRDFTEDGRPKHESGSLHGDLADVVLLQAPVIWNGLRYDQDAAIYVIAGAGAYDPISTRSLIDRGGENGYIMFANAPTTPAPDRRKDESDRGFWSHFAEEYERANPIWKGEVALLAVALAIPTGGASLTWFAAAGAVAGTVDGVLQAMSDNSSTFGEKALNVFASGLSGLSNPVNGVAGLGGGLVGGTIEYANGGQFLGNGYQAGSLVAGIATGGFDDYARVSARTGSRLRGAVHAAERLAVEGGFTAAAGAYGYAKTGTVDGALLFANLGSSIGGMAASRFVKCHIAGTPVHVPLDDAPPEAEQLVAAGPPLADWKSQSGDGSWRIPVGVGLLAAGVAGLAAGQSYRRRRRCEEQARDYARSVDSAISQQDSWLDSLADELCGLLAGRGGSRQPHARPNFVSAGPIH